MTSTGTRARETPPCAPSDTLRRAAQLMRENNVSALAVCAGPHVLAVITEADLVHAIAEAADPSTARVHAHCAPVIAGRRTSTAPSHDTNRPTGHPAKQAIPAAATSVIDHCDDDRCLTEPDW